MTLRLYAPVLLAWFCLMQALLSATEPESSPPPLPKGFVIPKLQVPEGYQVELAAGPPLVTHPMMACFDDRGRLFVCNNAGVNLSAQELEEQLPNSILILEDTDRDGRFDQSKVFADKMTYPMGGAWHKGALYVASPPYIWRLEDTDHDGIADKRDKLVSKFGYTGNAADIHGCFFGPDGRLYWCDGYHGHEFRDEAGEITSKREGSYIFSCRPDGSDVRLHCGGGMDNPVEVDFTDEGEVLGTVNIFYTRPRVDCFVHWLYGGAYPHRERVLKEIKTTGDLLGPVHRFGHVAIAGTMRYRSGAFDPQFRDNYFATFFNSGKVVRLELSREGSTFRALQREFLSSDSRDFHPTDVLEDADGSLLVIDTGGWFYRGCPTSQHAKPEMLGGIYRVRRQGMAPLVDPWGETMDWPKLTNEEVARLLNESRFQVRERAIQECANRPATIVPTLVRVLSSRDSRDRMGAIWALTRMIGEDVEPKSDIRNAIRLALNDRDPAVRQAATRSVATYSDPFAYHRLIELLHDDAASIRREAAVALGRLGDAKAIPALLEHLAEPMDRSEEHAMIYAMIEIGQIEPMIGALRHPSASVKRAALIVADQLDPARIQLQDVEHLLGFEDVALRRTVLKIYQQHATQEEWAKSAAGQLRQWLGRESHSEDQVAEIQDLFLAFASHPVMAAVIGENLNDPNVRAGVRDNLLAAIANGSKIPLHESWVNPLGKGLASDDVELVQKTIAAIAGLATDRFDQSLQPIGNDPKRSVLLRVLAMEAASGRDGRLTESAFALLAGLIEKGGNSNELSRAVGLIGNANLSKDQLLRLAPLLQQAGPMEIRNLLPPFERSSDADVRVAFLNAMEQSRSLLSVPPPELSDIIKSYPEELRERGNLLLERLEQNEQQRLNRLDALLAKLTQGDAARGRTLFLSEKSKCSTCHRVNEEGGRVGPDLSTIGANRSSIDLLESIVFPSATLVRDYQSYQILTTEGQTLTGLIVRDTGDEVYIQQQMGEPIRMARKDIESLLPSTVSLMPNGLDQALTEAELLDVVAYLKSLKAKKEESVTLKPK